MKFAWIKRGAFSLGLLSILGACSNWHMTRTEELRGVETRLGAKVDSLIRVVDSLQVQQDEKQAALRADLRLLMEVVKIQNARWNEVNPANNRLVSKVSLGNQATQAPQNTQPVQVNQVAPQTKDSSQMKVVVQPDKAVIDSNALAKQELDVLYVQARGDYNNGNFREAYYSFRSIYQQYARQPQGENPLFWMGMSLEQAGSLDKAQVVYDLLLKEYASGQKRCATWHRKILIYRAQKDNLKEKDNLQKLVADPKCAASNEAVKAQNRLKEIQ